MDASEANAASKEGELRALAQQIERAGRRAAEAARQRASKSGSAVYYADPADPSQIAKEVPPAGSSRLEREGRQEGEEVTAFGEEEAAREK